MKSKMTEIHGSDKYDKAVDYSVDRAIKLKKKKKKEASGQLKRKLVAATKRRKRKRLQGNSKGNSLPLSTKT